MAINKIKVIWVCSFSNAKVRQYYITNINFILKYLLQKKGQPYKFNDDSAVWNSNAIEEFEKFDDVELHVISPVRYLDGKEKKFEINGVQYYFFKDENSGLLSYLYYQFVSKYKSRFLKNRNQIKNLIAEINPDIVHVIGAENPQYSLAILDIPQNITTIIQLQALLHRLVGVTKIDIEKKSFSYKGNLELEIFKKADFIGTTVPEFKNYIREEIKADAQFLDISLAMGNKVDINEENKIYDFVYFAASISKAGDDALKAFALAHQSYPNITLLYVGGWEENFKESLDQMIKEFGLEKSIFFTGRLPEHSDVITKIRKAKFALLPLKMDFVPNTIREAICNGLPTITTITEGGTTNLNSDRLSVLLSEQGDHKAMSDNMIKLLEDDSFAETLKKNALITEKENNSNNFDQMRLWADAYSKIICNN